MKRKLVVCLLTVCLLCLSITGCRGSEETEKGLSRNEGYEKEEAGAKSEQQAVQPEKQAAQPEKEEALSQETADAEIEKTKPLSEQETPPPVIREADWSDFFHGLEGAAVLYRPEKQEYLIYNKELSQVRRSPCSTFKIISSLAALEEGLITKEDSIREWSGETFWNENWNRDIEFLDAFQYSCVWYYRKIIDELGADQMKEYLALLDYGNQDISDWQGKLNNNNNNPALTGFWIESSLLISPKEQTEVMERIFGSDTVWQEQTIPLLKEAMFVKDAEELAEVKREADADELSIYGKTGMGMSHGETVDAWFTGVAEIQNGDDPEEKVYFAVYLGKSADGQKVTSAEAKKIALQLLYHNF